MTIRLDSRHKLGEAGAVYEFNVKMRHLRGVNISNEDLYIETEQAIDRFSEDLHNRYKWVGNVYQTGRSGGWLAIEDTKGGVRRSTLEAIEKRIQSALTRFQKDIREQYGTV